MAVKKCCQYWRDNNIATETTRVEEGNVIVNLTNFIEVRFCPECGRRLSRGDSKPSRAERNP